MQDRNQNKQSDVQMSAHMGILLIPQSPTMFCPLQTEVRGEGGPEGAVEDIFLHGTAGEQPEL